jgi:O-acetyl-ADP-ribose deacetylase (regulator of RNase III)
MTKFIEVQGNLFDSDAKGLGHGVNTSGLMGAGIAVEFKHRYPEMYLEYKRWCKSEVHREGFVLPWAGVDGKWIYNIASQDRPGANARLTWLELGLADALLHAEAHHIDKIALPRIGCGIGGLDWVDVRDIIEWYAEDQPVDIEVWTL